MSQVVSPMTCLIPSFLFKDIYSKPNDFNEKPKMCLLLLVGKFC